jgi:DMSO/TMAO reductase YedYZ molybdopterin-dependent catalytic subunit
MAADLRGAFRGAVGALLWVAGTTLVAPLAGGAPLVGLAQFVIEASPGAVSTTAIEALGKGAQPALVAGLGIAALAAGAALGAYWSRVPASVRRPAVLAPVTLAGTAAAVATVADPSLGLLGATLLGTLPLVVYGLALGGQLSLGAAGTATDRRPFLGSLGAAVLGLVGVGALSGARVLLPGASDGADGKTEPLPALDGEDAQAAKEAGTTDGAGAGATVTATPAVTSSERTGQVTVSTAETDADFGFDFEGMPQPVTPLGSHYVVDKTIDDPEIDDGGWSLSVGGAAGEAYELGFQDLLDHPESTSEVVTMVCISNQVGGDLISTGRWRGVPLRALVEQAAPDGEVVDVVTKSADGYTEALPWAYVRDHPEVMVAYGLNGRTLSTAHGDPARLLVPGRYGMRSTKWLTGVELSTSDHVAYWEERGWDEEAVINTLSYLRAVQRRGDRVAAGGVAYAGLRGVDRVEVSFDGGDTWLDAALEETPGELAWHRWRAVAERSPGGMEVVTRATDGTGEVQTKIPSQPHPAGATGWHSKTLDL